jgi:hypothetical protein
MTHKPLLLNADYFSILRSIHSVPKIVALITVHANTGVCAYVGHNSLHMRPLVFITVSINDVTDKLKKFLHLLKLNFVDAFIYEYLCL